ncbi:arginine repressor [Lacticaseibacillus thailandensis]|nr:hypothetical protein [Lacticaseibacillus thailandensis]
MHKQARQDIIKTILNSYAVETQGQLVDLLADAGVQVTQATVSRDIKDMQLVKVPVANGRYRYSLPPAQQASPTEKLERTLRGVYASIDVLDKFVNLQLVPGSGPAVATLLAAQTDGRIFAMIPADASILIICRSDVAAEQLADTLQDMVG